MTKSLLLFKIVYNQSNRPIEYSICPYRHVHEFRHGSAGGRPPHLVEVPVRQHRAAPLSRRVHDRRVTVCQDTHRYPVCT